jgi:predicted transcriptional regulator
MRLALPIKLFLSNYLLTSKNRPPILRHIEKNIFKNKKGDLVMSRSFLWKSLVVVFGCAIIAFTAGVGFVNAAAVGQVVSNPQIQDAEGNPAFIPDFGTHVVGLFYSDTEASDLSDPMADAITAKKYDKAIYRGLGIANLKDSIAPNFLIKSIIKGKIEKYKTTILTDVDLTLPKAWGLGDCNNKSVFVLIGKDKKIKYLKIVDKKTPWNAADISSVIKTIDELVKK